MRRNAPQAMKPYAAEAVVVAGMAAEADTVVVAAVDMVEGDPEATVEVVVVDMAVDAVVEVREYANI